MRMRESGARSQNRVEEKCVRSRVIARRAVAPNVLDRFERGADSLEALVALFPQRGVNEGSQVCAWPTSERRGTYVGRENEGNARGEDRYRDSRGGLFSEEEWDVSAGEGRLIEKPEESS